jgi:predicted protein tyrosine phosphatase
MFIENCSEKDIARGKHRDAGENSMLIQIADCDRVFVTPRQKFSEVYQFRFSDIEDNHPMAELYGISDKQATYIARLLERAVEKRMNVIVHCFAGICRSGAVSIVGEILGMAPSGKFRLPNTRVKRKLMAKLGLTPV